MTRIIAFALLASTAVLAPALAAQNEETQQNQSNTRNVLNRVLDAVLGPEPTAEAEPQTVTDPAAMRMQNVLAASIRDEDRARDRYRHPAETLEFFGVEPGMTIAEYAPGGGWYSRVLAPYVAMEGRYHAVNADSSERTLTAEQRDRVESWPQRFAMNVQMWSGVYATPETAFESDEIPEGMAGTVDRIFIFRSMHGLLNGRAADRELRNLRQLLADDGMIGVVQHRAPESETWERANGTRGYVKQSDIIALFDSLGFALVASSEINANPNDAADYPEGVWTLPPVLRTGRHQRYLEIGESDRMTLLFRKAD
jgi:predicted methyltransferase